MKKQKALILLVAVAGAVGVFFLMQKRSQAAPSVAGAAQRVARFAKIAKRPMPLAARIGFRGKLPPR